MIREYRGVLLIVIVAACSRGTSVGTGAPAQPGVAATAAAPAQRCVGGRGRVCVMSLGSPAFTDGGWMPLRYTQAGDEVSPQLEWSMVPDSVRSFVLIVHDLDAATGRAGTDDVLHWMVWNIPAAATRLPEGIPHRSVLADSSRQISVSGPYYRGPGAPAAGPAHHYAFELYALDTMLDVPAVGASPAETRAAVMTAMAGRVRAKGVIIARYQRR
jgi:Raf kinase inhibitor-like YbhB/YbcL family protein